MLPTSKHTGKPADFHHQESAHSHKKKAPPSPLKTDLNNNNNTPSTTIKKKIKSTSGDTLTTTSSKTAQVSDRVVPKKQKFKDRLVHSVTSGVVKHAVGKYNFDETTRDSTQRLESLTGDANLASTLVGLAPQFADETIEAIVTLLETDKKFYSEGLKNTLKDPYLKTLLRDSLQATLLKIMENLAQSTQTKLGQQKTVSLADMLSHLMEVYARSFQEIKGSTSDDEYNNQLESFKNDILKILLPNKENDIILPNSKLIKLIGKKKIYALLEDVIIKNFDEILNLTKEPQSSATFDKPSKAIAGKAVEQLQDTLKKDSQEVVSLINENLTYPLPKEQQDWLAKQLQEIGSSSSKGMQATWGFLKNYLESLLLKVMQSLTLKYDQSHDDVQLKSQDPLKKVSLQVIALAADGLDLLDQKLIQEIRSYQNLPEKEKVAKLAPRFTPLVIKILNDIGIKSQDDLAVPSLLKKILWEKLTRSTLPKLIAGYVCQGVSLIPQNPNLEGIQGAENLKSTINTMSNNIVAWLQSNAAEIHEGINEIIPDAIELETIQSVLDEMVDPKDPSVKKLLSFIPSLKEFIFSLIVNMAASKDQGGMVEGDVMKKMLVKLSRLIAAHFKGKTEIIDKQLKDNVPLNVVFGPFLDQALVMLGINKISEETRKTLLKQTYKLYQLLKSPFVIQGKCREQFLQLMKIDISDLANDLDLYNERLKKEVQPLENMFGLASEKINEQIQDYMNEEAQNIPLLINELLPHQPLAAADQEWLGNMLAGVATSKDPDIKNLWDYISEVLKSSLMKLFIDVAKQFPDQIKDPETAKKTLVPFMLRKIVTILGTNLTDIQAKIIEINRESLSEKSAK